MRKYFLLFLWAIICTGFIYLSNCSKPLDANEIGSGSVDTVFVTDTFTFYDTLYFDTLVIDTLYIDTLIIDTLVMDTLFIDSSRVDTMYCARLNSCRRSIVWLLFNPEGLHEMEFQASIEGISCIPSLIIDVDDQRYTWDLSEGMQYNIEQYLEPYATVKIVSDPPHAYGRSIDICMMIRVKQ